MTLGEIALLNIGQFLEENSSERLLLSMLPATGRKKACFNIERKDLGGALLSTLYPVWIQVFHIIPSGNNSPGSWLISFPG